MPRPKKPEQEVAPHSPTTPPVMPRVQAQAGGESQDVILQMLQLFRDECEQKQQENIRRREAEEQRFNRLVATLGGQTMQQGDVSSPVGDPRACVAVHTCSVYTCAQSYSCPTPRTFTGRHVASL
ncbi:hypothetical protein Pcinc_032672 [Petrolisthes cinctipes]|uniref:Uncharacterized protein n=1 Tax=Petrolisthes cinctipes TaxID=88211 RepID=A0AAE1K106_PETCI|nr:hypothetical protein Pcinc_032672 [Petrolisthes cinctipes]